MHEALILAPTAEARVFVAPDGKRYTPPAGWACLPPGDAMHTRRVKGMGPSWAVIEKKGRKAFSKGLWAPAENIDRVREEIEKERATESYSRKRELEVARRDRAQAEYVVTFAREVETYLHFSPAWRELGTVMAQLIAALATPVGSGTVARTKRISVSERAEAATIAWMRHQTTAYDQMKIPRIKGMRREIRRELAGISTAVLDLHRRDVPHEMKPCPLCTAIVELVAAARASQGEDGMPSGNLRGG